MPGACCTCLHLGAWCWDGFVRCSAESRRKILIAQRESTLLLIGCLSWCVPVKAALKRPKTCQIVALDWLEDSMHARKRLPEEPFSHLRALKKERERERRQLRLLKGLEQGERTINPSKGVLSSRLLPLGSEFG